MRSSGFSVGGGPSVPDLTLRRLAGASADGFLAPTHSPQKKRCSTPDGPGHWAEGSDELAVNGLPMTPMLVVLSHTLPTVETCPGPLISGTASTWIGPWPCRSVPVATESGTVF